MNIVLYYAPNTCALAPYVTLTEANAPFETRPLNFRKGQQNSAGISANSIPSTRCRCCSSTASR